MNVRRRTTRVIISGIDTPHREIHCDFDVERPIGTGSVTIPAPRPAWVTIGAHVAVYAGYDGATSLIFSGRIPEDEASFSDSGSEVRVELEGFGAYLYAYRSTDATLPANTTLRDIFIAYCAWAGVPAYFADDTLTPGNTPVQFGGNADVDGGLIVVDRDRSFGDDITRRAKLYGYRHYDTPSGVHRLSRVSGTPSGSPVRSYTEGVNMLAVEQSRSMRGTANYVEVLGVRYSTDLANVAVRSIPATVVQDGRFGASGVNKITINDPDLVTVARADDVRNVHEIDLGADRHRWSWTVTGDPDLTPGTVVSVTSPKVGSGTALWLMRVSHALTAGGWITDLEGWAGGGTAMPAGNDCVTQSLLGSEARHVGNEYLSHYRRPNPDGLEVSIPFTVVDDYTTLSIQAKAHGANSFIGNTQSTASKFEIWQTWDDPDRAAASGEFPRQDENLERRFPYGPDDTYWQDVSIPLSGSLKAGSAVLKIISGYDSTVGDYDDYEVANVVLTTCGIGEPILIGGA